MSSPVIPSAGRGAVIPSAGRGAARGALAHDRRAAAAPGPQGLAGPAVTPDRFRGLMAHWPTAVSVVTARAGNTPTGCTVNALMSLSVEPPLLIVSLAGGSRTLDAIRRSGTFAVNLLCWEQRDLCQRFACGSHEERFRGVDVELRDDAPVLTHAAASVVCTVAQTMACADHVLILGAPRWHTCADHRSPLVLHRRSYHRVGA